MKFNSIQTIGKSNYIKMGTIMLRQPLPTPQLHSLDPFILLHHYGPEFMNDKETTLKTGAHPHRGFEPVTFLFQGEQVHRDSLGNKSVVHAGDVQWTTAGRGIVHDEGPTPEFFETGKPLEGIQLWINLPASKKMMPPNYQHVRKEEFNETKSSDAKVITRIIAGNCNGISGKIGTQTAINAFVIEGEKEGNETVLIPKNHNAMLYLLHGKVTVNGSTVIEKNKEQLLTFANNGEGISISFSAKSRLLFLSGAPINEPIASYGPYVMNTQTEILEAMRDFQMGKMGFLTP